MDEGSYCMNCGHHWEEHRAWAGEEEVMCQCNFDNPVCNCKEFIEIPAKTEISQKGKGDAE